MMKEQSPKNNTKAIETNRQALQARAKAKAAKFSGVFVENLRRNVSKETDQ